MAIGFFQSIQPTSKTQIPLLPRCGACGIFKTCRSPKMPVDGEGKKRILIIGEAPGKTEDDQGIPFIGAAGQLLERTLRKFDVDLRRDCWITNALICHPEGNKIKDEKAIDHCRPNLVKAVKELKPETIIPLGAKAVKSLIGWLWKEDVGMISRWDGWRIPSQQLNAWICPTWHPSYILRNDYGVSQRENEVRVLLFERHLKVACDLEGRPWKISPDWKKKIRIEMDVDRACSFIREFMQRGLPLAFDYETNMLKPDGDKARIISCAISDKELTVAFPWHGDAIKETGELLRMPSVPKIGWNIKFEERWTRKEFGRGVRNWLWDGMLATHVLDSRPDICSLKFQAFAQLGQDSYDHDTKPFLKADNSNAENRIKEIDLGKLLLYNGMDALLTRKIAEIQMKRIKQQ